jgi:GNAT superfamily N-acetyltransferase
MPSSVGERILRNIYVDDTPRAPSSSDEDLSARPSPTFPNGLLSGLDSFQSYTRPLSPSTRRASLESFASSSTTSARGVDASSPPSSPIEDHEDGLYLMSGRQARNAVRGLKYSLSNNQPPLLSEVSSGRYKSKAEWDQRLVDTEFALDLVDTCDLDSASTLAYYDGGRPVGIVVMQEPPFEEDEIEAPCASLDLIATHPNSSGVGSKLIEQAVNLSHEWGCGGRISLFSMTDGADKAYRALGFTSPNNDEYMLDPASSEQWHPADDGWRREKLVDGTVG